MTDFFDVDSSEHFLVIGFLKLLTIINLLAELASSVVGDEFEHQNVDKSLGHQVLEKWQHC